MTPSQNENEEKKRNRQKKMAPYYNLLMKIFITRQKHRLARERLTALETMYHTTPLLLITLISGILAFMSESEVVTGGNDAIVSWFTLFIGINSVVSATVQRIAKANNFGTRAKLHEQVSLGLVVLYDKLESDIKVLGQSSEEKMKKLEQNLDIYRGIFDSIIDSCTSPLPITIADAFRLMENRLRLVEEQIEVTKKRELTEKIHRIVFMGAVSELFNVISSNNLFPYGPRMNPSLAVNKALQQLETVSSKANQEDHNIVKVFQQLIDDHDISTIYEVSN